MLLLSNILIVVFCLLFWSSLAKSGTFGKWIYEMPRRRCNYNDDDDDNNSNNSNNNIVGCGAG